MFKITLYNIVIKSFCFVTDEHVTNVENEIFIWLPAGILT